MSWNIYDAFREGQFDSRQIDLESISAYIAIVTNTYTPDQNLHDFFDDITNEVSGTNYTAGGNNCANPVVTMNGSGIITFDGDDPASWAQSGGGFADGRRFILYDRTGGSDAVRRLIAYSDAEAADFGNVGNILTLELAGTGIFIQNR